jgi:mRNA-degrading endonuclease RelE of RelBE toxin-antitoxin system
LAEWELRIDEFRVFYDVDLEEQVVKIEAVGYKRGSVLFIRGEEYLL